MNIKNDIKAKSVSYGGDRASSAIKYLVYHYTGNDTDTAKGNANYFKNSNTRSAGAHYFVDDNDIYCSIDDNKVAWAVGGSKYPDCDKTGGGSVYGKVTNSNSISIEMCSKNGKITEKTIQNAAELGQYLMKKYNIPIKNVYRHFDITGKSCPGWNGWIDKSAKNWKKLLDMLDKDSSTEKKEIEPVKDNSFKVKIISKTGLYVRAKASRESSALKILRYGDKVSISKVNGDWGKLKDESGWIHMSYVEKIK